METQTTTPLPSPNMLLSWSAPTMPQHERNRTWYLIAGTIVLVSVVYGILSSNWTFSVLALLIAAVYYMTRNEPPPIRTITITESGVDFAGRFTSWGQCRDFWLIFTPDYTELHIARNRGGDIVIHTAAVDVAVIRQTLMTYIAERPDQTEKLIDMIIRICKL